MIAFDRARLAREYRRLGHVDVAGQMLMCIIASVLAAVALVDAFICNALPSDHVVDCRVIASGGLLAVALH